MALNLIARYVMQACVVKSNLEGTNPSTLNSRNVIVPLHLFGRVIEVVSFVVACGKSLDAQHS